MASFVKGVVDKLSVNLDGDVTTTQQALIAMFVGFAAYLTVALILGPSLMASCPVK
jgi:hypothetical protein